MANRYFLSVGTDWNDTGNWSASSGGAAGASVPISGDSAIFDTNSGNCTLEISPTLDKCTLDGAYGSTLDIDTATLDCDDGGFIMAGGTCTLGTGTIKVADSGDLTILNISGGTFTPESGTIEVGQDGGNLSTIISNQAVNHLVLNTSHSSGEIAVSGSITVNGKLTVTKVAELRSGTLECKGDIDCPAANLALGAMKISISGSTDQTIQVDGAGATGGLTLIDVASTGGTVTFKDNIQLFSNKDLTIFLYTSGTVVFDSTSTITFRGRNTAGGSWTWNSGALVLNHFVFNAAHSNSDLAITGTLDVNDCTITAVDQIKTGTLQVRGDLASTDTSVTGTSPITLSGTAAQTITLGTGRLPNGTFTVNKASGTATLASAMTLDATGQDLVITSGTLDLDGNNLTVDGTLDVDAIFVLKGSETLTTGVTDTDITSSTWKFTADVGTILPSVKYLQGYETDFFNLQIAGASSTAILNDGAGNIITVNGALSAGGTAGTRTVLRTDAAFGTKAWHLDLQGTSSLTNNVDVADSDASAGNEVSAVGSTNSGGNTNWDFGQQAPSAANGLTGFYGWLNTLDEY